MSSLDDSGFMDFQLTRPSPIGLLQSSKSAKARKYGGVSEWPLGRFAISNANVQSKKNGSVEISLDLKNTGPLSGSEVVQVYVKDLKPVLIRPEKELKAFARVSLHSGEQKKVILKLNNSSFEYYNDIKNGWERSKNGYQIMVGTSSKNAVSISNIE